MLASAALAFCQRSRVLECRYNILQSGTLQLFSVAEDIIVLRIRLLKM